LKMNKMLTGTRGGNDFSQFTCTAPRSKRYLGGDPAKILLLKAQVEEKILGKWWGGTRETQESMARKRGYKNRLSPSQVNAGERQTSQEKEYLSTPGGTKGKGGRRGRGRSLRNINVTTSVQ